MHNQFRVRKWTQDKLQNRPYDVVYLDYTNNNMHSEPDLIFSTESEAQIAVNALNKSKKSANAKAWPIDGPIPDDMTH